MLQLRSRCTACRRFLEGSTAGVARTGQALGRRPPACAPRAWRIRGAGALGASSLVQPRGVCNLCARPWHCRAGRRFFSDVHFLSFPGVRPQGLHAPSASLTRETFE